MTAAEGRAVAGVTIDSVTTVTVYVRFERLVMVILEWEQKGLRGGDVVSAWNDDDGWSKETPTFEVMLAKF